MSHGGAALGALLLSLGVFLGCGGGPELACPEGRLPSPDPSYVQTLEGLSVVPTRAALRSASDEELASFEDLAARLQASCEATPIAPECEIASLRARLRSLPAPAHPDLFTGIDDALDPSLDRAHADFPTDRDCDGQAEAVCDARVITTTFARARCDLRTPEGHE